MKKAINGNAWKNPHIEEGRKIALARLKPTEAELEHGFELHEQATVIEAYGFAAFVAPDLSRYEQARTEGAAAEELTRLDLESRMTRMADDPEQGEYYREAWEAAGVTCVMRQAGEEGNDPLRMLERLAYNIYVTDRMRDLMIRATTPDDIVRAKKENKRCFYMMTNGVPLPGEFRTAAEELCCISRFFQLGVRMMHLTYNRRNAIGDGCAEPNDGGLSAFGRDVVREMNRVGVIVDVAHSSTRTALDAAKVSSKPVVVSHSACRALRDHCRAKPDDVIKAVAESGGYMSICCLPRFLGRSGDIVAFLDHIDYAVKLVGADHVAIGTDKGMAMPDMNWDSRPSCRARFENFWPPVDQDDRGKWNDPDMAVSMYWTNYPLFTVGLVKRGYSDEDIIKILGGNVLRVARDTLT